MYWCPDISLTRGFNQLIKDHKITNENFKTSAAAAANAFKDLQYYLESDLSQHTNEQGYACGGEAFQLMMRYGHFLELNLDDYVRYAEDQIVQADAYLNNHAKDFGSPSPTEALGRLAEIHPTVDKYYLRFGNYGRSAGNWPIKKQLVTWPDFPIQYVPQPLWARDALPIYISCPTGHPLLSTVPRCTIILYRPLTHHAADKQKQMLRSVNDSVIKTNHVVHHGSIGHHVQNWNAYRSASRIGQVAGTDCASRLAMFCFRFNG